MPDDVTIRPLLDDRKKAICGDVLKTIEERCINDQDGMECLLLCMTEQTARTLGRGIGVRPFVIPAALEHTFELWIKTLRDAKPV